MTEAYSLSEETTELTCKSSQSLRYKSLDDNSFSAISRLRILRSPVLADHDHTYEAYNARTVTIFGVVHCTGLWGDAVYRMFPMQRDLWLSLTELSRTPTFMPWFASLNWLPQGHANTLNRQFPSCLIPWQIAHMSLKPTVMPLRMSIDQYPNLFSVQTWVSILLAVHGAAIAVGSREFLPATRVL
jgi:hypothetical protein